MRHCLASACVRVALLLMACAITSANQVNNAIDSADTSARVCGVRKVWHRNPKIVNGKEAYYGQYPWAVSIRYRGRHHCGGALLNEQWVLTAAHCLARQSPTTFTVKLGGHYRNDDIEKSAVELAAKQLFAHEGFSFSSFANDIGLVKLYKPVEYNDYVAPVCLPDSSADNFTDQSNATVIGWGRVSSSGPSPNSLQMLDVPILDNHKCIEWYHSQGKTVNLRPTQFCAGFEEGGKDACQGDSGGPLMVDDAETGRTRVVGIVSAGIGCALPKLPGLYTKVSAYLPWIRKKMKNWSTYSSRPIKPNSSIIKANTTRVSAHRVNPNSVNLTANSLIPVIFNGLPADIRRRNDRIRR